MEAAGEVVRDADQLSPYERIRDAILDGTFAAGSQLVELTIASLCGVSRTPIREALMRLEQDGLVERGPRGLVVKSRSPEEILDIYEVRIVLEAAAARAAAERHTRFDQLRLMEELERTEQIGASDVTRIAQANNQFHRAIWQASRNKALVDLLQRLSMHLLRYPETTLAYSGRWDEATMEHRAILKAIVARDADTAARLAEAHFTRARDIRLELWGLSFDASAG